MAELVDARDLKSLALEHNTLKSLDVVAKLGSIEPQKSSQNPGDLQNNLRRKVSINRVRARGRRYAYIRGTDIALVRGFEGTDDAFERELDAALVASGYQVRGRIDYHRRDAARQLLKAARGRSLRKEMACPLTEADIVARLVSCRDRCEVSGIPFDYGPKKNAAWRRRPFAPSLDRVSNCHGYELENLRLVCTAVNIGINEWGLETFAEICRGVTAAQAVPG